MKSKSVLVLGAGLVARPHVRYLLDHPSLRVVVASRTLSKAIALIDSHDRGSAVELNLNDSSSLEELISETDLVISLVPYAYHVKVADLCIAHGKHMITTSYVSEAMLERNRPAVDAGVLILNEIGLDPGIDHMSAMRVFHDVWERGGEIVEFRSFCGGLPAPEANDNPFGYKFSWSPYGVLLAGKNSASYLEEGRRIDVPSEKLFVDRRSIAVPGAGMFEAYPNRDSISYVDTYGLGNSKTVFRATLRNPGWCETMKVLVDIGYMDIEDRNLKGMTYAGLLENIVPGRGDLRRRVAHSCGVRMDSRAIRNIEWLGLFETDPIRMNKGGTIDVLTERMLERMSYRERERDMIVLHHRFTAQFPTGRREAITSTLIDYGCPGGDSAMARTVGLPAAIAARFILDGTLKSTGVQIPIEPDVYRPILEELAQLGIGCVEKLRVLS